MTPGVIHLVTGEYPPGAGGVGDYTEILARGVARAGGQVHVWCPEGPAGSTDGVVVHALPDRFGPLSRRAIDEALETTSGCLLLQYVPNAIGARGANLAFCRWIQLRGRRWDVRVMFHEPYFYFGWHPGRNALALVQRAMAHQLLRAGRVAYLSTDTWQRYLQPYAPDGLRFVTLPIPATVAGTAEPSAVAAWRARLLAGTGGALLAVHFGTFGGHMAAELRSVIPEVLSAHPSVRFICAGRGSELFAQAFAATGRVMATGALPAADVAAVLRACDLAVQPYPDGVTTRRTTVMAGLVNEVPTVSTDGALTEPVWRESGAVALARAGDSAAVGRVAGALLRDREARRTLGEAGGRVYGRLFALERTVARIVEPVRSAPASS